MADDASSVPATAESTTPKVTGESPAVNGSTHPTDTPQKDVAMMDAPTEHAVSPANLPASPVPARTGTPTQASRAASVHPDPGFSLPSEAPAHGDSTRRYLNTRVTGALLEGMKLLAQDQPEDPLRVLGEYLLQKSKELEGSH